MTTSDWRKITKQLKNKPAVLKKFLKTINKSRKNGMPRKDARCVKVWSTHFKL
jgi:hypothetical protein